MALLLELAGELRSVQQRVAEAAAALARAEIRAGAAGEELRQATEEASRPEPAQALGLLASAGEAVDRARAALALAGTEVNRYLVTAVGLPGQTLAAVGRAGTSTPRGTVAGLAVKAAPSVFWPNLGRDSNAMGAARGLSLADSARDLVQAVSPMAGYAAMCLAYLPAVHSQLLRLEAALLDRLEPVAEEKGGRHRAPDQLRLPPGRPGGQALPFPPFPSAPATS